MKSKSDVYMRFVFSGILYMVPNAVLADNALNQIFPIDWRATPLIEAINDLSERLNVPYVLDASVSDESLRRPVRITASKLSGRQAFRWTVKSAGLDAMLVNGAMLVAAPERLPRLWKALGRSADGHPSTSDLETFSDKLAQAETRRVELAWVDVPLSRVSRDISDKFGIDVVFHPAIQLSGVLIRLEAHDANLQAVRQAFAEQIKASCRYEDGVLWIAPPESITNHANLEQSPVGVASKKPQLGPAAMNRPLRLGVGNLTWNTLEGELARAGGLDCRIRAAEGTKPPVMSTNSTVFETLEGMRLLAGWVWHLEPPISPNERPTLAIDVPAR